MPVLPVGSGIALGAAALVGVVSAGGGCSFSVDYTDSAYVCAAGEPCPHGFSCDLSAGMCRRPLPPPSDAGDAGDDAGPAKPPPWWDPAFRHRRRITVTAPPGESLPAGTAVALRIELDGVAGPAPSFAGARIVRHVGSATGIALARVVDANQEAPELVWFRVPVALAASARVDDLFLYLGDAVAGAPPDDPLQVFTTAQSFDKKPDDWTLFGNVSFVNGKMYVPTGTSARRSSALGPGTAVDLVIDLPLLVNDAGFGFTAPGAFAFLPPYVAWLVNPSDGTVPAYAAGVDDGQGPKVTPGGALRRYSIERTASRAAFGYEGSERWNVALPGALGGPLDLLIVNSSTGTLQVDSVRTRAALIPGPTVTAGPDEPAPGI